MEGPFEVHVSEGNEKLGKTANISLPPVITCAEGVPCSKGCYALKAYRIFPSARKNWNDNIAAYQAHPKLGPMFYFSRILDFLREYKGRFFRWHVSGDIPDPAYFYNMVEIAKEFPNVAFLTFTKKYEIVNEYLETGRKFPRNFKVVFSDWGKERKVTRSTNNPFRLPVARYESKYEIVNGTRCSGSCDNCRICWTLNRRETIVLPAH